MEKLTTEQLINFETAKLAMEKGFEHGVYGGNIDHIFWYFKDGEKCIYHWDSESCQDEYDRNVKHLIPAPTQSLLQKWLREEHEMHAYADCNHSGWFHGVDKTNGTGIVVAGVIEPTYETYEEALEVSLQEALGLIK